MPVVVDIGGHRARVGLSGEERPRVSCPTSFSVTDDGGPRRRRYGHAGLSISSAPVGISNPLHVTTDQQPQLRGCVSDYSAWVELLQHGTGLLAVPEEDCEDVVVLQKSYASEVNAKEAATLAEHIFETLPATRRVAFVKSAAAVSAGAGQSEALVIEAGHTATSVAAVVGGRVLPGGVLRCPYAGHAASQDVDEALRALKLTAQPRYFFERSLAPTGELRVHLHDKYAMGHGSLVQYTRKEYWAEDSCRELKETLCSVSFDPGARAATRGSEASGVGVSAVARYVLPDGNVAKFNTELVTLGSVLFEPYTSLPPGAVSSTFYTNLCQEHLVPVSRDGTGLCYRRPKHSVAQMLVASALYVDRASLEASKIFTVGGHSLLPFFSKRLRFDTLHLLDKVSSGVLPAASKVGIAESFEECTDTQALFAPFTGGSLLGEWSGLDAMYVSREQFADEGLRCTIDSF